MTFAVGVSEDQINYSMNLYEVLHNFTGAWLPYACSIAIYAIFNRHFATSYTTIRKFGVSKIFFLMVINTSFQQRYIQLIKGDNKDIYNITKDLYFK